MTDDDARYFWVTGTWTLFAGEQGLRLSGKGKGKVALPRVLAKSQ